LTISLASGAVSLSPDLLSQTAQPRSELLITADCLRIPLLRTVQLLTASRGGLRRNVGGCVRLLAKSNRPRPPVS
jgi:hypothetical protein